jgi:hypothetical protein
MASKKTAPAKKKTAPAKTAAPAKAKAAAPSPKVTKSALRAAFDRAREGHVDEALPTLEAACSAGSAEAAYALAEIHAFRGEWDRALDRLLEMLPNEGEIYAGNVKRDAAGLAWRGAEETQRWKDAEKIVAGLDENAVGGVMHETLLAHLKRGGKGAAPQLTYSLYESEGELRKAYARAKAAAGDDAFSRFLAAADDALFDADAVAAFDAALPELDQYDYVLSGARACARRGKLDQGWMAVHDKLDLWMNVEHCQIVPAELVWDPSLRTMMTPERCAAVLARS